MMIGPSPRLTYGVTEAGHVHNTPGCTHVCETCQAAPRGIDGRHCEACNTAYLAQLDQAVVQFEQNADHPLAEVLTSLQEAVASLKRLAARADAVADAYDRLAANKDAAGPYCCAWCGAALSDGDFGKSPLLCRPCRALRYG